MACVVAERLDVDVARRGVQRNRFWLVQACFEAKRCCTELDRLALELVQQPTRDPAAPSVRRDVHPLQLAHAGLDQPYSTARDRLIVVPPDQEDAKRWSEFGCGDRGRVALAVADHVFLLHGLGELDRHRSIERSEPEIDIAHSRSCQPWSTGPMPAPSAKPAAIAPVT